MDDKEKRVSEAIVTAGSNFFFPHILSLISSIHKNYPDSPHIIVYSIGLGNWQKDILKNISKVLVYEVPHFVSHWRSCYTWKLFILANAPADIFFYLDATSRVLAPLTEIFNTLHEKGVFCVSQASFLYKLGDIITNDLALLTNLNLTDLGNRDYFAAGAIGYQRGTIYEQHIEKAYELACLGWTLGWSDRENYRNTGHDISSVKRECKLYRHDQSVLNAVFYGSGLFVPLHDEAKYCGLIKKSPPEQIIWNGRRGTFDYEDIHQLPIKSIGLVQKTNLRIKLILYRLFLYAFCVLRKAKIYIFSTK